MTDQDVPAAPAEEAAGEAAMQDWAELLVERARAEGVELTGDGGLLTGLVRQVLQTGLEAEMADHLGYERHAVEGRGSGNSRNGSSPKRVTTEIGEIDLRVPRDRAGTFEPVTVPKHQRRLDGLSGNVISLYAKGLTIGEIQAHLAEIYDTSVSRETISKITDEIAVRHGRVAEPAPRARLSGAVDRRDNRQSPRLAGPLTGPSTSPSASIWPAIGTCWGCGWGPPAARAPSSGRPCWASSATGAWPTR